MILNTHSRSYVPALMRTLTQCKGERLNVKPGNLRMEKEEEPAHKGPPGAAADGTDGGFDGKLRQLPNGTWGHAPADECLAPPPWYDEGLGDEFGDSGIFDADFRAFLDAVDQGATSVDSIWQGSGSGSVIHMAAVMGDLPLLRALLVRGANISSFGGIHSVGGNGDDLFEAMIAGTPVMMILQSMRMQRDVVRMRGVQGNSVLPPRSHYKALDFLLSVGADPKARPDPGEGEAKLTLWGHELARRRFMWRSLSPTLPSQRRRACCSSSTMHIRPLCTRPPTTGSPV